MHQVATWKGDSLLCNLKAHCGNMENLWLKTVQQIVFLVVSEHSLVVENLRTSYIVWVIQLFGMFEIWKRKIIKRQTKNTNTKCVSWMITTFNDEFVLPFFFPAPFLVLVAQASSTKDLLCICSSCQALNSACSSCQALNAFNDSSSLDASNPSGPLGVSIMSLFTNLSWICSNLSCIAYLCSPSSLSLPPFNLLFGEADMSYEILLRLTFDSKKRRWKSGPQTKINMRRAQDRSLPNSEIISWLNFRHGVRLMLKTWVGPVGPVHLAISPVGWDQLHGSQHSYSHCNKPTHKIRLNSTNWRALT